MNLTIDSRLERHINSLIFDSESIFPIKYLNLESKFDILENAIEYESYKINKSNNEKEFLKSIKNITEPSKSSSKKISKKKVKDTIYKCTTCNKIFSGASGLWYHNVNKHNKPVNKKKRKLEVFLNVKQKEIKQKEKKKPQLTKKLKLITKPKKKKIKTVKEKTEFDLNKFVEGEKFTDYWCANCDKNIPLKKSNGIGGHKKYCLNSDRAKQGVVYRKNISDKEEELKLLLKKYLKPEQKGKVVVLELALKIYNKNTTKKIIVNKKINPNFDRFKILREKRNNILSAFSKIMKNNKKNIVNVYSFIIEQLRNIENKKLKS